VTGGETQSETIVSIECLDEDRWAVVGRLAQPRHGLAVMSEGPLPRRQRRREPGVDGQRHPRGVRPRLNPRPEPLVRQTVGSTGGPGPRRSWHRAARRWRS
jgi:hypothetical protein